MSHFVCVVLVPNDTESIVSAVGEQLAPFDENIEVDEYDRECFCIGRKAHKEAGEQAAEIYRPINQLREIHKPVSEFLRKFFMGDLYGQNFPHPNEANYDEYWKRYNDADAATTESWQGLIKPLLMVENKLLEVHPDREAPAPDCSECGGTGTYRSTYNPQSQWDWYVIGGRWDGWLLDLKPESKEVVCSLCSGSGLRPDWEKFGEEWRKSVNGCNGCHGTGKDVVYPNQYTDSLVRNMSPVRLLPDSVRESPPYAAVDLEGNWRSKGKMHWFGVSDDTNTDEWPDEWRKLLDDNPDAIAVACDLHI